MTADSAVQKLPPKRVRDAVDAVIERRKGALRALAKADEEVRDA